MTQHPNPLVDHVRLTVLTELQALVEEAFPPNLPFPGTELRVGTARLLDLVQARRRALLAGALPLEPGEAARVEP